MNVEQIIAQQAQQLNQLQTTGFILLAIYLITLLALSYALFEALRSFTRWMEEKTSTERAMQQYLRTRSGPSKPETADNPFAL